MCILTTERLHPLTHGGYERAAQHLREPLFCCGLALGPYLGFFGARLGPAFFLTAALFALGHLAVFDVSRLAVFFPALLFGWLRERTGTVVGACLLHAGCNLYELTLRTSFFGF